MRSRILVLVALGDRVLGGLDWIELTGGAAGAIRLSWESWEAATGLDGRRQRKSEMGPVPLARGSCFPEGLRDGKGSKTGGKGNINSEAHGIMSRMEEMEMHEVRGLRSMARPK